LPAGRRGRRLPCSAAWSGPARRRRCTSWPDQTIPLPTSASLQVRPITIDDQFREPLRPVFLFQLLFCQIVSELRRHLEFGDQPLINQRRQIATVTRLSPNVPSSALPIARYGWTTSSGTPPEYDW